MKIHFKKIHFKSEDQVAPRWFADAWLAQLQWRSPQPDLVGSVDPVGDVAPASLATSNVPLCSEMRSGEAGPKTGVNEEVNEETKARPFCVPIEAPDASGRHIAPTQDDAPAPPQALPHAAPPATPHDHGPPTTESAGTVLFAA